MRDAPGLDDIRQAQRSISGQAVRTPLVRFDAPDAPAEIYLKLENLQPAGAFKTRGATHAIARLPREALRYGVWTASAGNMARAVAQSARQLGVPCAVIVPDTAPQAKLDGIKQLGGRVVPVPFQRWWQTLGDRSYPGIEATFIHPFDDKHVIAGNGTIGLEIIEDLPAVDTVLVPWGGGGLSIGIAAAVSALAPKARVFAVEVETGAPLAASLDAGTPQTVDYRPSFVDGIGSGTVFPNMLALAHRHLAGSIVVTLSQVAESMQLLASRSRVVAEGAGAAALAAALTGQAGAGRIACIVSGGNLDMHKLAVILDGGMP